MQKEQFIHVNDNDTKFYYSDRKMTILHREDGPAIEYDNGGKSWWFNGKRHREDGPAIEEPYGYKEWYLNDKFLTEEEFNERVDPPEITLTLDEIASKFGVSVSKLKIKK
jgi:hypothetical protein